MSSYEKVGDPFAMAIEVDKMQAAGTLGTESGLFAVPEILAWNRDEGLLRTASVRGFRSIYNLTLTGDPGAGEAIAALGEAMALVHGSLRVDTVIDLPEEWATHAGESHVFIHGDLTTRNVGISGDGSLFILDWSAAPALGVPATVGSRVFDVQWMCRDLFSSAPWKSTFAWPTASLADPFLESYVAAAAQPLSQDTWDRFQTTNREVCWDQMGTQINRMGSIPGAAKRLQRRLVAARWSGYRPPVEALA